jgi:hypothetical protein
MMATLNGLPVFKIKVDESLESNQGIDFISLVDFPAIESNWVALSSEKRFSFNQDKQLLFGAILIPDQPIYRYSKEMGEYYVVFTKEEILKLVRKFQAQQKTINLNYQHKKDTQIANAVVQEIWIVEQPDKSSKYVEGLPDGSAFVVAHIGDSKFWNEEVKTGNVRGFSIEGFLDMELNKINMQKSNFVSATTKDGVVVKTDADAIAVGVEVYIEDEAGNKTPAPDGEHILDNGMVITVSGGKVTEISEVEVEDEMDKDVEAVLEKAFNKFFSQAIKSFEAKLAEMEVKFANQPAGQPATKSVDVQPTQLSKMDKVKEIILKSKTK